MCMCLYVELACLDSSRYVCGFVMLCDFVPLFQNLLQEADTVLFWEGLINTLLICIILPDCSLWQIKVRYYELETWYTVVYLILYMIYVLCT